MIANLVKGKSARKEEQLFDLKTGEDPIEK